MFHDVHRLALLYHWSRTEILSLTLPQRFRHLMLIEAEEDAELFAELGAKP